MKGANKMLRVAQWYTENENKFIGMSDYEIDTMIDTLPYFSEYDYFNRDNKNYMKIVADSTLYEWVFDEDYICISCTTYEIVDIDDDEDETLYDIELEEWYKDRI